MLSEHFVHQTMPCNVLVVWEPGIILGCVAVLTHR